MQVRHLSVIYGLMLFTSCASVEKASRHGFEDGYYSLSTAITEPRQVYVENTTEEIRIYPAAKPAPDSPDIRIPMRKVDSVCHIGYLFRKNSLDLDITTLPFKYRFARAGMPAQLNSDFNAALYAGWRFDSYRLNFRNDALGRCNGSLSGRGFDFGIFTGIGGTPVNEFTTAGASLREYNAPLIQSGAAIFIESNVASFGIALGADFLTGSDRRYWIYQGQPWLGFIVGMAMN
jgi:hypothetical protein